MNLAALAQEDFNALDYSRAQNLASSLLRGSAGITTLPPLATETDKTVIIIAVLVAVAVVILMFTVGFVGFFLYRRIK